MKLKPSSVKEITDCSREGRGKAFLDGDSPDTAKDEAGDASPDISRQGWSGFEDP